MQEWEEFFGPSSANYILSWFIQMSAKEYNSPPFFKDALCRAIYSINPKMLLGVDLPAELSEKFIRCNDDQLECHLKE
jgi:hypothetical protein